MNSFITHCWFRIALRLTICVFAVQAAVSASHSVQMLNKATSVAYEVQTASKVSHGCHQALDDTDYFSAVGVSTSSVAASSLSISSDSVCCDGGCSMMGCHAISALLSTVHLATFNSRVSPYSSLLQSSSVKRPQTLYRPPNLA